MSVWASETKIADDGFSVMQTGAPAQEQAIAISLKKCDSEQQIVFGEVYVPGFPDSEGDFMTAETIQSAAYEFMRRGLTNNIDLNHDFVVSGCYVVESFIAREGDPVFIPGSWVLGVKVADTMLWNMVKSGVLNGFSFGGEGFRVERVIELDIPSCVEGITSEVEGHEHSFTVRFSDDGELLGGSTGPGGLDGHTHTITRGTITDPADDGHVHRYSFVEGIVGAQD